MTKTILITGCSTGFGLGAAEKLARQGHRVYATLRDLAKAEPLERLRDEGLPITIFKLDVTKPDEVDEVIAAVTAAQPIDVLINNAGFEIVAPVEHLTDAQMLSQFETNVFGVLRMIRGVLPAMRARRSGRIINLSSVVGHMGVAHRGAYCASKHAVEGLSKSLWIELRPFGIDVISIAPGAFPTQFAANYVYADGFDEDCPYWPFEQRMREGMGPFVEETKKHQLPEAVVDVIARAVAEENPRYEWLVGSDAEMLIPLSQTSTVEASMGQWYASLGMTELLVRQNADQHA